MIVISQAKCKINEKLTKKGRRHKKIKQMLGTMQIMARMLDLLISNRILIQNLMKLLTAENNRQILH